MSLFAVFLHIFVLLPFSLIVSLSSTFVCLGDCITFGMLMWVFVNISLLSASMPLECPFLCTWANWPTNIFNLSSACGLMAFYILFPR